MMSSIVTHYDYVFTLEANSVEYYRSLGANVHFCRLASIMAISGLFAAR